MKDNDLSLALDRIVADRKRVAASSTLRERVWAIPTTTPQRRSWLARIDTGGFTMFSALRFIAAGITVALTGGFLIMGALSTPNDGQGPPAAVTGSPSPVTTEEFLSTMVTEEVEPGVVRVLSDRHRDLTHPPSGYPWDCERVIVGGNDQVWRTDDCWRLFRLGQAEGWDYDQELVDLGWARSFASLDGRLWALEAASQSPTAPYYLRLFDDGAWVPDPRLGEPSEFGQIHVEDDGTVWLLGTDGTIHWAGDASVEGEFPAGSSSWGDVWAGEGDRDGVTLLSVTDDGVAWLMTEPTRDGAVSFLRFDGTDWGVVPGPEGFDTASFGVGPLSAGVSASGTLWTAGDSHAPHVSLSRLDEQGWTVFTDADGVEPWGGQRAWWNTKMDTLWVAPDGSVWVNASTATIPANGTLGCDGLARFDGETWQSFFSGSCISDLGFAPDGSAWVVARDEDREVGTYVITPEAVMGAD